MIKLYDHQIKALNRMKNGCILNGGVGSGKSLTAIAYYFLQNGGEFRNGEYEPMDDPPRDLYIITPAVKRDKHEWEGELFHFLIGMQDSLYDHKVIIDSWQNIKKYKKVTGAFFIFDEQKVSGSGVWVKTFLNIARKNKWILLSATPGDTWLDYAPVFIANGFYQNKTDFKNRHVIESHYQGYPKVEGFMNEGRLLRYKMDILIPMKDERKTTRINHDVNVLYDKDIYKEVGKTRWNIFKDEPIVNAAELCYTWRKIVNSHDSRIFAIENLCKKHPKVIIFYNFDYELEILKGGTYEDGTKIAEWNGHKHEAIPKSKHWVYLVQYSAGNDSWNCIETDTIIFYSQTYSYKIMTQAAGRIDRANTEFRFLYYYHLKSKAPIDLAISRALSKKKKFNEKGFVSDARFL